MSNRSTIPELILQLSLAFLKNRVESVLGKEFVNIASTEILRLEGKDVNFAIENLVKSERGYRQLLDVAKEADTYFRERCTNQQLREVLTMPLGDLSSVQVALLNLPRELDTLRLEEAIRVSLRGFGLAEDTVEEGVQLYAEALQRSLIKLERYTLTVIAQTMLESRSLLKKLESNHIDTQKLTIEILGKVKTLQEDYQTDFRDVLDLLSKILNFLQYGQQREPSELQTFTVGNWINYFDSLLTISKNFFESEYNKKIPYKVPSDLDLEVSYFMQNDTQKTFIIEGSVGTGKTSFLYAILQRWADENKSALDNNFKEKIDVAVPPLWVPIFISLKNKSFRSVAQLTTYLVRILKIYGLAGTRPIDTSIFELVNIRWALLFDGLDEQRWSSLETNFDSILELPNYVRNVKIIIATRPVLEINATDPQIARPCAPTLSEKDILDVLKDYYRSRDDLKQIVLGETKSIQVCFEQVEEYLRSDQDIWTLCRTPLYLNGAIDVLQHLTLDVSNRVLPLRKRRDRKLRRKYAKPTHDSFRLFNLPDSVVLSRALKRKISIEKYQILSEVFKRVIEREADRKSMRIEESKDWHAKIGEIALKTDGGRDKRFRKQTALNIINSKPRLKFTWMLIFGIIDYADEMPGWFLFPNFSVKIFFAREYMIPFLKAKDYHLPRHYLSIAAPEFRVALMDMLSDQNPHMLSLIFMEANHEHQRQ